MSARTVRAAVFLGPGQPMVIETLDLAAPQAGEVMIKVLATGLCHTDLHVLDGALPHAAPAVLGHESSGIVVATGDGVDALQVGDHVVPFLFSECGVCDYCLSGKTNFCLAMTDRLRGGFTRLSKNGVPMAAFSGLGTFADHIVVKADRVAKVRTDANPLGACFASCAGATGLGSVKHTAVAADSTVAVFGLGGVGLTVVQGAHLAGARIIVGIDRNPEKEEMARRLGATHFIDAGANPDLVAQIHAVVPGGVTHSYECVGIPALIQQAIDATNMCYGRCTLLGVAAAGVEVPVSPHGFALGRTVGGLSMGGVKARSELPGIVADYADGHINFDDMVSHRLRLEDINHGFDLMRQGKSLRAIIEFD